MAFSFQFVSHSPISEAKFPEDSCGDEKDTPQDNVQYRNKSIPSTQGQYHVNRIGTRTEPS